MGPSLKSVDSTGQHGRMFKGSKIISIKQRALPACDKPTVLLPSEKANNIEIRGEVRSETGMLNGVSDENMAEPELQRYWELEQDSEQITDVQGWLKAHINFWEEVLKAPQAIIEWISEGYKLPLLSIPPEYARRNQRSALLNVDFVSSAIANLLSNHCTHISLTLVVHYQL